MHRRFDNIGLPTLQVLIATVLLIIILSVGQVYIVRTQFHLLLLWQLLLAGIFLIYLVSKNCLSFTHIFIIALLTRLSLVFVMPNLSDDVYRFIWDGQLINNGDNPLLTTPNTYLAQLTTTTNTYLYWQNLHSLINHPQFYTCYPPLMQGTFWVSALLGGASITTSIIIIKLFILIADMLGIYYFYKLLKVLKIKTNKIVWYALNPLVILEGVGNTHYEVVQVAFMVMSLYFFTQNKLAKFVLIWATAILTKLLPLLLLPIIVKQLGWRKAIVTGFLCMIIVLISFLPFLSLTAIKGFSSSLNLYFRNFEFNASLYYIARYIGWYVKGYNYISFIGPLLSGFFLGLYAYIFFTKKINTLPQVAHTILIVLTLYYLLATTVHPWYIINLLPFAIISNKSYAVVWQWAAFVSYYAYSQIPFAESTLLLCTQYGIVAIVIAYTYLPQRVLPYFSFFTNIKKGLTIN